MSESFIEKFRREHPREWRMAVYWLKMARREQRPRRRRVNGRLVPRRAK